MTLTRKEAVGIAGTDLVKEAESVNCAPTNRVTNGTEWHGYTEYSAYAHNDTHFVRVYYFQDTWDADRAEDLSDLAWVIEHYEVKEMQ